MTTSLASNNILSNLYWDQVTKLDADKATRQAAQSMIASTAKVIDAYDADVSAVHLDATLSAYGRAAGLIGVSKTALDQIDASSAPTLAALDAAIVASTRALRAAAAGPDASTITELRAVETRAVFAQIDPVFQPGAYLGLCASGTDDAACIAVEQSNGFAPLLKAEIIEQGRTTRGARALPEQQAALDAAVSLRAILSASVTAARRHMTVAPLVDPLKVAAMGAYSMNGDDDPE